MLAVRCWHVHGFVMREKGLSPYLQFIKIYSRFLFLWSGHYETVARSERCCNGPGWVTGLGGHRAGRWHWLHSNHMPRIGEGFFFFFLSGRLLINEEGRSYEHMESIDELLICKMGIIILTFLDFWWRLLIYWRLIPNLCLQAWYLIEVPDLCIQLPVG